MVVSSVGRLAVVIGAVTCGMLLYEHGHRVLIEAPMPDDPAVREPMAVCPRSDNVPYGDRCVAILGGDQVPTWRERLRSSERETTPAGGSECPENDNQPYPPGCIRFLSGWFWRVN